MNLTVLAGNGWYVFWQGSSWALCVSLSANVLTYSAESSQALISFYSDDF
jgi:hypothetical protein